MDEKMDKNTNVGVLFDLDGTLADTSLDIIESINQVLNVYDLPACDHDLIKTYISDGLFVMLQEATKQSDSEGLELHKMHFMALKNYNDLNGKHSMLFDGITDMLSWLDESNINYGIVTNKQAKYANPLVTKLGLENRVKTVVSGDTCSKPKPSSEPMLLAANDIGVDPARIFFLGDAITDVQAAHNSGMHAVAVSWGFHKKTEDVNQWNADFVANNPKDLIDIILTSKVV